MPALAAHEEPPPQQHIFIVRRPPPPTPKPTPQPPKPEHIASHVTQSHHAAPFRPHLIATENDPNAPLGPRIAASARPDGVDVAPGPVASAAPAATAEPKPACSVPFAPAVATDAVAATIPDGFEGETGIAQVRVTLDAAGKVTDAAIYRSAGNFMLDRAAIAAARMSRYRAEIRDCEPAGGSYLFTVDFQS